MSDRELEPMSPEVQQLLADERTRSTLSEAALERLGLRLEHSVAWATGSLADPGARPSGAAQLGSSVPARLHKLKLLAMFVAGGLMGAGADRLSLSVGHPAPSVEAPAAPPAKLSSPEPDSTDEPKAAAPAAKAAAPPTLTPKRRPAAVEAAPTKPEPSKAERDALLARERSLLELARTALGRGKIDEANRALAEHERDFPTGSLIEEREMLAIRALWLEHRVNEARTRAAKFRERYPNSLLLPAIAPPVEP
jgi:hypothetical protein